MSGRSWVWNRPAPGAFEQFVFALHIAFVAEEQAIRVFIFWSVAVSAFLLALIALVRTSAGTTRRKGRRLAVTSMMISLAVPTAFVFEICAVWLVFALALYWSAGVGDSGRYHMLKRGVLVACTILVVKAAMDMAHFTYPLITDPRIVCFLAELLTFVVLYAAIVWRKSIPKALRVACGLVSVLALGIAGALLLAMAMFDSVWH